MIPFIAQKSYEDKYDYIDEYGNEVRINRKRPNEKQVGRFTFVDEVDPKKSYEDYYDYIDEHGNEVRINRKRPNEKQVGRFTFVDYIPSHSKKKSRKKKAKSQKLKRNSPKSSPKIKGFASENVNLYKGKQVGRFKILSLKKSSSPKIKGFNRFRNKT